MRCGLSLGKISTSSCTAFAGRISFEDLVPYQFAIHLRLKQVLFGRFLKGNPLQQTRESAPGEFIRACSIPSVCSDPHPLTLTVGESLESTKKQMIGDAEATSERTR